MLPSVPEKSGASIEKSRMGLKEETERIRRDLLLIAMRIAAKKRGGKTASCLWKR